MYTLVDHYRLGGVQATLQHHKTSALHLHHPLILHEPFGSILCRCPIANHITSPCQWFGEGQELCIAFVLTKSRFAHVEGMFLLTVIPEASVKAVHKNSLSTRMPCISQSSQVTVHGPQQPWPGMLLLL